MNLVQLTILVLLGVFSLSCPVTSEAQIYRYKDENGRWHYTDKKPAEKVKVEEMAAPSSSASSKVVANQDDWVDLSAKLEALYNPQSVVEEATLAVVSIETTVAVGSGFFISDGGYLVTNKHVIRPKSSTSWAEQQGEFDKEERVIAEMFEDNQIEKRRLESMEATLRQMRQEVSAPGNYIDPTTPEEYRIYNRRFNDMKRAYDKAVDKANRRQREFRERKRTFSRTSTAASLSQHFKVVFKDGTIGQAHLLELSSTNDLALLQVTGFVTPHLNLGSMSSARQGVPVYALGSPLGRRDSVTSGIITRASSEEIVTDAKVLPGNSGGPLIDSNGDVLGINTQRVSADQQGHSEGFGLAIPISTIKSEFSKYLQK
ncbi:trypsin-like peptidase domain-containing protein [Aurantivibrio plasticivorans]